MNSATSKPLQVQKNHSKLKAPASEQSSSMVFPACQTMRWSGPYERERMQMEFSSVPREKLIQVAWGESMANPHESVAGLALYYLESTETHLPLRNYFSKLASEIGAGKFTARGLAIRYPIRKGNKKTKKNLQDLCDEYAKAGSTDMDFVAIDYSAGPQR